MRVDFEWGLLQEPDGSWSVHERLSGTELINQYNLPTRALAESVIRIRRAFVHRTITSRTQAVQIFEPRPNLEALRLLQNKGHLDS